MKFSVPRILGESFLDNFLEGTFIFPINCTLKPGQSQKKKKEKRIKKEVNLVKDNDRSLENNSNI